MQAVGPWVQINRERVESFTSLRVIRICIRCIGAPAIPGP